MTRRFRLLASSLRFILALTLALLLVPKAYAQDGPQAAYRAFLDAAPDVTDPEAMAPYMTHDGLQTYGQLLQRAEAEDLEQLREMMQGVWSLPITSIDVVSEKDDEVMLDVNREPETMRAGMPRDVTTKVQMQRENGSWKIVRWRVSQGRPYTRSEIECAGRTPGSVDYGNPKGANALTMQGADGTWNFHFDDAPLVKLEGDRLEIRFPAIDGYGFSLVAEDFDPNATEQEVYFSTGGFVPMDVIACMDLRKLTRGAKTTGTLTIERFAAPEDGGTLAATFTIPAADGDHFGYSGRVDTDRVMDATGGPVAEGTSYVFRDERHAADQGRFLWDPAFERLFIDLGYNNDSGAGSTRYAIPEFSGAPGVYVGDSSFGETEVFVLQDFSEEHVAGEVRAVPTEEMPEGDLTPDEALSLGRPEATFEAGPEAIVIYPALTPLQVDAEE